MKIIRIPKGRGRFRTVYAPELPLKKYLRQVADEVGRLLPRHVPPDVVHGFVRGCSPVSNAVQHIGYRFTVTMDLRDFFDTVTVDHVKDKLPPQYLNVVFYDGAPRQGLPSSPAVCNLAATGMDSQILEWLGFVDENAVYTRYADDLTISTNDETVARDVPEAVTTIAACHGFTVAKEKTHIYTAKGGRRIVTGVAVDETGIHPTRRAKRRLRAALHQRKYRSADGLREWMKLKPPHERDRRKCRDVHGYLAMQRQVAFAMQALEEMK